MNCQCGHPRHTHDYHDGCLQFLCCDRRRNLTPGHRHQEHDGVNHRAHPCTCERFTATP